MFFFFQINVLILFIFLLTDYRYLEETKMTIDRLQKNKAKRILPINLQKMKQAAHNRGIRLEYLPYDSTKRRGNSTYFNWSKKELLWKIEWIFPQAEHVQWITERCYIYSRYFLFLFFFYL